MKMNWIFRNNGPPASAYQDPYENLKIRGSSSRGPASPDDVGSVRQQHGADGDQQRTGVRPSNRRPRLVQCSSCFKEVYISQKSNTTFKSLTNNIHQGEGSTYNSLQKNFYQCEDCQNSMCLVCSAVDVTISHFYGQVSFHGIGIIFGINMVLSGWSSNRLQDLPSVWFTASIC